MVKISNSSLIDGVFYNDILEELTIFFKQNYYTRSLTYINFSFVDYRKLIESDSIGKHFLNKIKNKFKLKKMSENEKRKFRKVNNAKDANRYIDLRINVKAINKDWFYVGEKGDVYLDMRMIMKPNGKVDQYGNLGMIVQRVPAEVYKKDKETKGAILGNGSETEWENEGGGFSEQAPGVGTLTKSSDIEDDLPF